MNDSLDSVVSTCVGPLRVQLVGSGPPAVLWHSLFVDRSSWTRVAEPLAAARSLVIVESPGHGGSPIVGRDYTYDDLAQAAGEILGQLGIDGPVDWLGSALGGHVGIVFAAHAPARCRSLLTIGTPVHALGPRERRQMKMLSLTYPRLGSRAVLKPLMDAMVGPATRRDDREAWDTVADSFRRADRAGMAEAIRSASLLRPDLTPLLGSITAPTIFATSASDSMWTVAEASASAAQLADGAVAVFPVAGHIGPLFHAAPDVVALATRFWDDPAATVAGLRSS
jgi:pimeloyl-ACP methyl ester carboxylesterase